MFYVHPHTPSFSLTCKITNVKVYITLFNTLIMLHVEILIKLMGKTLIFTLLR